MQNDAEPLDGESESKSDKTFDKFGILSIEDTGDSPVHEGTSQMGCGLIFKIGKFINPSYTLNSFYGNSCALCTIDNDKSGLFDFKSVNKMISGIPGQSVTVTKVGIKNMSSTPSCCLSLHSDEVKHL